MKNKPRRSVLTSRSKAPSWMVTYGDMVTLLLTFFVLLLSFASLDETKFGEAVSSLKGAFGILERYRSILKNQSISLSEEEILNRMNIYNSVIELQTMAKKLGYEDAINIDVTDKGMLIRLGNRVLFDLGKAQLRPEAYPVLDLVAETIRNSSREVQVSGHTDNIPISVVEFPSNWELSTARATNVVRYLISQANVPPEILAATGYSEYRPIVDNDTPAHRQENRRVEFLITWK